MKYKIKEEVWKSLINDGIMNKGSLNPGPQDILFAPNHSPFVNVNLSPEEDYVQLVGIVHWFKYKELEKFI